jgi:hypothetical protein
MVSWVTFGIGGWPRSTIGTARFELATLADDVGLLEKLPRDLAGLGRHDLHEPRLRSLAGLYDATAWVRPRRPAGVSYQPMAGRR